MSKEAASNGKNPRCNPYAATITPTQEGKRAKHADKTKTATAAKKYQLYPKFFVKNHTEMRCVELAIKGLPAILSLKDVAFGLYTFVYVNLLGTTKEAFSARIYKAIRKQLKLKDSPFVRDINLLAIATRRTSKIQNKPLYSHENKTDEKNQQKVFVVRLDDKSAVAKKLLLCKFQDVSTPFVELPCNNQGAHQFIQFLKTNIGIDVSVKVGYDETDDNIQSLDNYITDESIINILRATWKGRKIDRNFYANERDPSVLKALFSEPYPELAGLVLGYPDSDAGLCFTDDT